MLKCTIFFVFCFFVQLRSQETIRGSNYNPYLIYNYPYKRYARRAQSDSVVDSPRRSNPAYDVTPKRSQPAYDVNPPTRSQSVYDVNPPRRSQSVYDVNPPTRSQSVYDVNPPTRSQSVYDVNPPTRSQSVYDVNPPTRSQSVYDVNPPTRSQPAYDVSPSAYELEPSKRLQSDGELIPPQDDVYRRIAQKQVPNIGSKSYEENDQPPQKLPSAYWVEPYKSNAKTPLADDPNSITAKVASSYEGDVYRRIPQKQVPNIGSKSYDTNDENGSAVEDLPPQKLPSAYWVEPYQSNAKTPLADDSIAAKDASGYEGNQEGPDPASESRAGSNVRDRDNEPRCILPPLPEHGSYVKNDANPTLRLGSEIVTLNVTCDPGYMVHGAVTVHCYNGFWADDMPKCLPVTCPLKEHHSVEYRCLVIGDVVGSRACHEEEPVGTMVSPLCRKPHYYSTSNNLAFMHCGEDGTWDHVAKCTPECGTVTANGHGLVVGGQDAKRGELPWHVGVYLKRFTPYMQICGGTLISNKLVISAAHCFWDDLQKQLPASDFALAAGKLYRPFEDKMDDSQTTDVKEIHIPPRFQGASSNFQDDIAVVIPAAAFEYRIHVRPVCLSFDSHFDRLQLQTVHKGKVAGWGLTAADGRPSPVLQVVELPYVEVGVCIEHSPQTFVAHITSDKICAGVNDTSTALCRGDSGGGLTFVATDRDTPRYYLRGIVSTAPSDEHECNTHTYTSFTHVQKHEDFIKQFITEA